MPVVRPDSAIFPVSTFRRGPILKSATSAVIPVLVCTLAIFLYSAMDAGMKFLVIAVGVYNAVMWRSLLAAAIAGAGWIVRSDSRPTPRVLKIHVLRAVIVGCIFVSFFWGLARLPLAVGIGLSFVAPLFALFLASVLLGERIRLAAIVAAAIGLGGVVVILAGQLTGTSRTHDAMLGAGAILVSALLYGYNLVLARKQAQLAKPLEIMFFQNLSLLIIFGAGAPWLGVHLPREYWALLAGVTALSLVAQYLMSWAYARAETQYLISTEYSAFVWAMVLGWLFFAEPVTWPTLAGASLIIASCWIATRASASPRPHGTSIFPSFGDAAVARQPCLRRLTAAPEPPHDGTSDRAKD